MRQISLFPAPLDEQWREAKAACGNETLLLFRMGDFYEALNGDARVVAGVLELVITPRHKGDDSMPMTGFSYHQLDSYVSKLVAAGHRVAICERLAA
jgi:DNA mismatch repair protein MutS